MDPVLHTEVYGKEVNKLVISRHAGYVKTCYFPNSAKNHVWRARSEAGN